MDLQRYRILRKGVNVKLDRTLHCVIDHELWDLLQARAATCGVSVSAVVRLILHENIDMKIGLTKAKRSLDKNPFARPLRKKRARKSA